MLAQKPKEQQSSNGYRLLTSRDTVILFGLISLVTLLIVNYFPTELTQLQDVWFDADTYRISESLLDNMSMTHYRSGVHPIFPMFSALLPILLNRLCSFDAVAAIQFSTITVAVIWIIALYLLLKLMGCSRLDASILSLLGLSSSGAMFWLVVPESYSYGSITILLALCFTCLTEKKTFSPIWYVFVSAMTFGITVTNWMFGIASAFASLPKNKVVRVNLIALFSVGLITLCQKLVFRHAAILNPLHFRHEGSYMAGPSLSKFMFSAISFWSHSMVMPKITREFYLDQGEFLTLSIQKSLPSIDTVSSFIALLSWLLLLAIGIRALFIVKVQRKLKFVLIVGLFGQFLLHLIYGTETFLYSLHFVPLFVTLVAFSSLTSYRLLSLILAIVFIISSGFNNSLAFQQAISLIQ